MALRHTWYQIVPRRGRRRRPRHGGAESLLNEADVRFDFSRYTDIDNMVDVNGGWAVAGDVGSALSAEGLFSESGGQFGFAVTGVPGPIHFGSNAITWISVVDVPDPRPFRRTLAYSEITGNGDTSFSPDLYSQWDIAGDNVVADKYSTYLFDLAPGNDQVFSVNNVALPAIPTDEVGVFLSVSVLDVAAHEIRFRFIGPVTSHEATVPFTKPVPDFVAAPLFADTLAVNSSAPGATQIEWLAWNRALTDAEVDLLVAHFTA